MGNNENNWDAVFHQHPTAILTFSVIFAFFTLLTTGLMVRIHRLQHNKAMSDIENRFSATFEQAAVGIAHISLDGHRLRVNDRLCQILACSRDELLASVAINRFAQQEPCLDKKEMDLLLNGELSTCIVEKLCDRKGSTKFWARLTVSLVRKSDGSPDYFIEVLEDIDLRKQAEKKLRLAGEVFTHAHEAIVITDVRERIVDINPTFTQITGYTREQVLGETPRMLSSGKHDKVFFGKLWHDLNERGIWRGELWNRRRDGSFFISNTTITAVLEPHGEISHYIGVFSDVTALRFEQERLEHLAHYDSLTQLPNRTLLMDRLEQTLNQAQRNDYPLAVCFIDLDNFKEINDTHGTIIADLLLAEVARRLKGNLRPGDTAARLGGDEFVLLISHYANPSDQHPGSLRFFSEISQPIVIQDREIKITASMGISIYPDDNSDADTLLRHADQSMYQAKLAGRNQYMIHDPVKDHLHSARAEFLKDIRGGMNREEFELYYQPKVNLRLGKVIGMEALIRWNHPREGLLTPGRFITALNGEKLSIDLDFWVLRRVMRQISRWENMGLDISVSVNLSSETLLHSHFIDQLEELIKDFPFLDRRRIQFEILETTAISDLSLAERIFQQCQELGFDIALDDFGTGYSSLIYFRHLPANVLKIDQSFVRDMLYDPNDMAIVQSIVGLAQVFKREVIAEGVENPMVAALLISLGCDVAQGYAIAKPMPAQRVTFWLQKFKPDPQWLNPIADTDVTGDMPIALVGLEHRRWIDQLETWLRAAPNENVPMPEIDGRRCRLGRWYLGAAQHEYAQYPEYALIEPVHEQIHKLAEEMMNLRIQGNLEAALAQLPLLHRVRDRLLAKIDDLWRVVALEQEQAKKTA